MSSSILRKLNSLLFCLFFVSTAASASLTDMKFGASQIADSQWNVNACLNTNTCQIYSKNPGTAYKIPWTNGKLSWAAGDYVKFALSGNASFPYTATQYTSAGAVKAVMGGGKIVNMGPDYFFFVGTDNNTGQLFSGSSGMSNTAGVTWTGTLNPTTAQADAYASANYSTTPLAPGETASAPPPPPPPATPVYSSSISASQQSRRAAALSNIQGHNAEVNITGSSNDIHIEQAGSPNYILLNVLGNSNKVDATQTASGGAHMYNETMIIGDRNDLTLLQTGTTNKTAFVSITGNDNTASVIQKDSGQHYLQLDITGNNHNASVLQEGTGSHNATVTLDGSQPWNFGLTQSGATNQTFSLPHAMSDGSSVSGTCSAVGGCNLNVTQN